MLVGKSQAVSGNPDVNHVALTSILVNSKEESAVQTAPLLPAVVAPRPRRARAEGVDHPVNGGVRDAELRATSNPAATAEHVRRREHECRPAPANRPAPEPCSLPQFPALHVVAHPQPGPAVRLSPCRCDHQSAVGNMVNFVDAALSGASALQSLGARVSVELSVNRCERARTLTDVGGCPCPGQPPCPPRSIDCDHSFGALNRTTGGPKHEVTKVKQRRMS